MSLLDGSDRRRKEPFPDCQTDGKVLADRRMSRLVR
jgi:hypothetical protein